MFRLTPGSLRFSVLVLIGLLVLSPAFSLAGMTPEEVKKFNDYKAKAEKGDSDAQRIVGSLYNTGRGVEIDLDKAFEWLSKAAASNDSKAQFELGAYYMISYRGDDRFVKASDWFRKAAEQGHIVAQFNLGTLYSAEFIGIPKDQSQAVYWWRKAALQGHAEGQFRLALCYGSGDGVLKDKEQAFAWMLKAAEQDNLSLENRYFEPAAAQFFTAISYANGEGVKKDPVRAGFWYLKAAHEGDAPSQFNLAHLYADGQGVAKDEIEAYAYYNLAGITLEAARKNLTYLEGRLSRDEVAAGQKRTKELQKEIEAKTAAKKAVKVEPAKHSARQYPDDSRPELLFGHAEAMNRPNVIFIDNRLPALRSFKKAYYTVDSATDKLRALALLLSINENSVSRAAAPGASGSDDISVKQRMELMNASADRRRDIVKELHEILGE